MLLWKNISSRAKALTRCVWAPMTRLCGVLRLAAQALEVFQIVEVVL